MRWSSDRFREARQPRGRVVVSLVVAAALLAAFTLGRHVHASPLGPRGTQDRWALGAGDVGLVVLVGLVCLLALALTRGHQVRRVSTELRAASDQYRSLFDHHPHGVFSVDLEGRFTEANAAAEHISGWSEAELLGRSFVNLLDPASREAGAHAFAGAFERTPQHVELTLVHRRGRSVPLHVTGLPIVVDDVVVGVYGIARDLTYQDTRRRALERANQSAADDAREKAAFLTTLSHEIRTPLTSLLAAGELLADTDLDPLQRETVAAIDRSGRRLHRLIDDVLDFSKLGAGKVVLEDLDVDVRTLVDDAAGLFRHVARSKGVSVGVAVSDEVPGLLRGDPVRLSQVLGNLVGNAVKFTDDGSVLVSAHVEDDRPTDPHRVHLRLDVVDTGIGLSPAQCRRLFTSFSQADPSIARRYGGTGLGLAISRDLVALMGGSIWVSSEEGRGSTFSVRVPMQRATVPG